MSVGTTIVIVCYREVCFLSHAVIVASLTSLSGMVDENNGAVEMCVQLNHRPIDTIVTAILTTQPLTATGIRNSHGAPPQVTNLTARILNQNFSLQKEKTLCH